MQQNLLKTKTGFKPVLRKTDVMEFSLESCMLHASKTLPVNNYSVMQRSRMTVACRSEKEVMGVTGVCVCVKSH